MWVGFRCAVVKCGRNVIVGGRSLGCVGCHKGQRTIAWVGGGSCEGVGNLDFVGLAGCDVIISCVRGV